METESFRKGEKEVIVEREKSSVRFWDLFLRFIGFTFSLAAALALGLDKQTAMVPITLVASLPPINVPVTASWDQMSAFMYFLVTNIIGCSYGAISLIFVLASRSKRNGLLGITIIIVDVIMVAVLASGNGAAAAVGVLGHDGNKHTQWNKVCDRFGKYCHQLAASVILSLFAALSFLLLVLRSAIRLHNK